MKSLLERIGWSQAYLAKHLGVSERTVANWCRKEPNKVAMKYLELICNLVGV